MPINQLALGRHHELAAFLQSRRARLAPELMGIPRGNRRRTPGLRRGEVAALAGISLEWYTWLEQGRDINVSVQLLESLVRALQLDENERTYLFLLALKQPPPVKTFSHTAISPIIQHFLDQLGTAPAYVVDGRSNIVAGNKACCAVFGDCTTASSERERNSLWRLFTSPNIKHPEWKEFARQFLARFRTEYGRFIEDPWWTAQIAELSRISPEFRELWARQEVFNVLEGYKSMRHPLVGDLAFEYLLFQALDSSDLRVFIYMPRSHSGTAEKIERLLARESELNAQNILSSLSS